MSGKNNKTNKNAFSPARTKLRIASIDKPEIQICAQYNPKELSIAKTVNWEDHKSVATGTEDTPRTDSSTQDDLTFKGGAPRTISIELLFDGYEENQSVEPDVETLEELASAQPPGGPSEDAPLLRPHHCIITWGIGNDRMRPFLCVISKLDVKYTMWDTGGRPLRATCTVSVTEAIQMKKGDIATPGRIVAGQRGRRLRG